MSNACQAGRIGMAPSLAVRSDDPGLGTPFWTILAMSWSPLQGDPECKSETSVFMQFPVISLFSGKSAPCPLQGWSGICLRLQRERHPAAAMCEGARL
jgi:hypothetical protein